MPPPPIYVYSSCFTSQFTISSSCLKMQICIRHMCRVKQRPCCLNGRRSFPVKHKLQAVDADVQQHASSQLLPHGAGDVELRGAEVGLLLGEQPAHLSVHGDTARPDGLKGKEQTTDRNATCNAWWWNSTWAAPSSTHYSLVHPVDIFHQIQALDSTYCYYFSIWQSGLVIDSGPACGTASNSRLRFTQRGACLYLSLPPLGRHCSFQPGGTAGPLSSALCAALPSTRCLMEHKKVQPSSSFPLRLFSPTSGLLATSA